MHPARFSFLAHKHAQRKLIIERFRDATGHWHLKLECGHDGECVAHMDVSKTEHWRCSECGEEYVKKAPQYAVEFN